MPPRLTKHQKQPPSEPQPDPCCGEWATAPGDAGTSKHGEGNTRLEHRISHSCDRTARILRRRLAAEGRAGTPPGQRHLGIRLKAPPRGGNPRFRRKFPATPGNDAGKIADFHRISPYFTKNHILSFTTQEVPAGQTGGTFGLAAAPRSPNMTTVCTEVVIGSGH